MPTDESLSDENRRLRRLMRDVLALSTLPAVWTEYGPGHIAVSLADVLVNMLSLDLLYICLHRPAGEETVEVARSRNRPDAASQVRLIAEAVAPCLNADTTAPTAVISNPLGDGTLRLAVTRFGYTGDIGVMVAGSQRSDFPNEGDRLLLGIGANQTGIMVRRKQVERSLDDQRERLRVTLSSIGDAVITTDTAGRVATLNPVAEKLTGWMQDEAAGRPLGEIFCIVREGTRQQVENPVAKVLTEGNVVGLANHTVLIAKHGNERPIDDSAAPIRDANGRIVGVVLIFRDITERRRSEEEREELSSIIETSTDIIGLASLQGEILYFNEAGLRLLGLESLTEAKTRTLFDFVVAGDRSRLQEEMLPAILREGRWEGEWRYRNVRTGATVPVSKKVTLIRKPQTGEPLAYATVSRDISDRKRAEEALRGSERRLRDIIDNWPSIIFVKDSEGRYLLANRACGLYAHEPPERMLGKTDYDYLPQEVADRFRADDRRVLQSGTALRYEEVVPVQGEMRTALTVKFPLCDASGQPYAVCGIATDITELKTAEEALKEADRRKDEFLAMLAHELRNPLAPIRNAVAAMRMEAASAVSLQWARDVIERQVTHLTHLVDDLLDVSRIASGKIMLQKEPLEIAVVVDRAVEASRPLIKARRHMLEVQVSDEPVRVEGDLTRLAQVVLNLLNNSAKYTPEGGTVWLTTAKEQDEAVIRVRDTGHGIPANMLTNVFEMFTQVDPTIDRSQGGLGIGLTLVRKLVEMHDGTVQALSDGPGKGSEFVVRLPLLRLPQEGPVPATETGETGVVHPNFSRRVLVVDDNRDSAESAAMLLRLLGHEVRTAYDGPNALNVAKDFHPEVVLLDIGLPVMNGYEVAKRLRLESGMEKVVLAAMTGYGQDEDRRQTQEAGFDHHLVKPVDPEALQEVLKEKGR